MVGKEIAVKKYVVRLSAEGLHLRLLAEQWECGSVADGCAGAAAGDAGDRVSPLPIR